MTGMRKHIDKAALTLILLLTAFLTGYNMWQVGDGNAYYTAAVKSMLMSFHNFFYASFDPGGFITVDKPALGLWLQCLFGFVFGVHGWSLMLPEILCALGSVALLYNIVKDSWGTKTGLLAALFLAVTPIFIAATRTNNFDPSLLLVCLLALRIALKAAETGKLSLLLLSMALIGLGFNIKMLQAFLYLPACGLVYLLTAPISVRGRMAHLTLGALVLVAVSLSWCIAVDLTPAEERPYIGSSSTNSALELALGYNGLDRLTGDMGNAGKVRSDQNITEGSKDSADSAAQTSSALPQNADINSKSSHSEGVTAGTDGGAALSPQLAPDGNNRGGGLMNEDGAAGVFRLFNTQLYGQISWLLPLALAGAIILGVQAFGRKRRGDRQRTVGIPKSELSVPMTNKRRSMHRQAIQWLGLLIPMAAFFSIAGFYHRYYLIMLAPCLAVLSALAIRMLCREVRLFWRGGARSWKLGLVVLSVLVTALLQIVYLLTNVTAWSRPLMFVILLLLVIVCLLSVLMLKKRKWRLQPLIIAILLADLLAAPACWAFSPIVYGINNALPSAGPPTTMGAGMFDGAFPGGMGDDGGVSGGSQRPDSENLPNAPIQDNHWMTGEHANGLPSAPDGMTKPGHTDGGPGGNNGGMGMPGGQSLSESMISYMTAHDNGAHFLVAVPNAGMAEPIILKYGRGVMAIGGFKGTDNAISLEQFIALVKKGELQYYWASGRAESEITRWVIENSKAVNMGTLSGAEKSDAFKQSTGTLYDQSDSHF